MSDTSPRDIAQRGYSLALKRLQEKKATNVAQEMGLSDTAVSNLKNEVLEKAITLLAHLDIKLVPADSRCMSKAAFDFLTATHERVMQKAPQLVWDDAE